MYSSRLISIQRILWLEPLGPIRAGFPPEVGQLSTSLRPCRLPWSLNRAPFCSFPLLGSRCCSGSGPRKAGLTCQSIRLQEGEVMYRTNRRKFLGYLGAAPRIGKALGGDVKRAAIGVHL